MMLLALLLAAQAPAAPPRSVDGLPIGGIPPQQLPESGCADFLWTNTSSRVLVAMLTAAPARIRFAPGGSVTDLVRIGQQGGGNYGFALHADYAGGDWRVAADIEIVDRGDLTQGAAIPSGTLRIDREGGDTIVVPVVGLIGCAS